MMNWLFNNWAVFQRECKLRPGLPTIGLFWGYSRICMLRFWIKALLVEKEGRRRMSSDTVLYSDRDTRSGREGRTGARHAEVVEIRPDAIVLSGVENEAGQDEA